MRKHLSLMFTALLAVATIIIVVIYYGNLKPAGDDLPPDYTVMTKAELSALVTVNPNWNEPRAQLTRLLLEEGQADTALQHMLILAWSDWDMSSLENQYYTVIHKHPEQADACLSLLASQRKNWLWPREMLVKTATVVNRGDYVLAALPDLLLENPSHPLAIAALEEFLGKEPLIAWEIGRLMGTSYLGQVVYSVNALPEQARSQVIPAIVEKYPDEPFAEVLDACLQGGSQGLDKLLALEEAGLTPWDALQYSEVKLALLFQALPQEINDLHLRHLDFSASIARASTAHKSLSEQEQGLALNLLLALEETGLQPPDAVEYSFAKYPLLQAVVPREAHLRTVTEAYFAHVLPNHIFYIIENWAEKLYWTGYDEHGQMQAIQTAAAVLARDPSWSHIAAVVQPPYAPAHQAILASENRRDQGQISQLSLSPDGNQMIYFTANTIWWYDLQQQQYRLAQTAPAEDCEIYWSPDSRTAVLKSGNTLQFYSTGQPGMLLAFELGEGTILGWQDNHNLLSAQEVPEGFLVNSLDIRTGLNKAVATVPYTPYLSPTGKLAWANIIDNQLTINIQGITSRYTLPGEDLALISWLDGDRGVLLKSGKDYLILDFVTGAITQLAIKGNFIPHAPGWSMNNKIPGTFTLGVVNHVMVLDLETMTLNHTGIQSYYGAFSGNFYWQVHSDTVYIYKVQ